MDALIFIRVLADFSPRFPGTGEATGTYDLRAEVAGSGAMRAGAPFKWRDVSWNPSTDRSKQAVAVTATALRLRFPVAIVSRLSIKQPAAAQKRNEEVTGQRGHADKTLSP